MQLADVLELRLVLDASAAGEESAVRRRLLARAAHLMWWLSVRGRRAWDCGVDLDALGDLTALRGRLGPRLHGHHTRGR